MNLKFGDHLLYKGDGFVSKLIQIKTWSPVSHIEIYVGNGMSVASRDGKGVGLYPLRTDGLFRVLRPLMPIDAVGSMAYFKQAIGQKYDWWGLFRFFTLGKQSLNKQFCSEFATRFDRAGHFEPFSTDYDADLVSPGMFLSSPVFLHYAPSEL